MGRPSQAELDDPLLVRRQLRDARRIRGVEARKGTEKGLRQRSKGACSQGTRSQVVCVHGGGAAVRSAVQNAEERATRPVRSCVSPST